ncbi:MAG: GNAT family N-acetyltransferase [Bacteroidota bacterium]
MTNLPLPTRKTSRLLLRAITDADLSNVFTGLSDPAVTRYYGVSYDSLEATKAQLRWFAAPEQRWWAICAPDNQTFYGAGGLNDIDLQEKKAEIGLWLLPSFWGQGIMQAAFPLIVAYGFEQLGLHRIEGFVETGNTNCRRAMAKLDFTCEKILEEAEGKNGEPISLAVYAKTRA